jgi:hypothetical protein
MGMTDAALKLLRRARTAGDIRAALEAAPSGPALRATLTERYDELAASPRRDPAANLRAELLRALHPMVTVADRERLEKALTTYEFGPLGENCSGLRAAALLALADLEPELAETYAINLLGDRIEHTEKMSGEPALTAVRFLAARGATGPIFLYAQQGGAGQETLAEAYRSLAGLPAALVVKLAWRMLKSADPVALVGLFDLLTAHPEPAAFVPFVKEWALTTDQFDVLHFAAVQAIATRREPLLEALEEAAKLTGDPERRALIRDSLGAGRFRQV